MSAPSTRVTLADVDMPFWRLVWVIAMVFLAILPSAIVVGIVSLLLGVGAGLLVGIARAASGG